MTVWIHHNACLMRVFKLQKQLLGHPRNDASQGLLQINPNADIRAMSRRCWQLRVGSSTHKLERSKAAGELCDRSLRADLTHSAADVRQIRTPQCRDAPNQQQATAVSNIRWSKSISALLHADGEGCLWDARTYGNTVRSG